MTRTRCGSSGSLTTMVLLLGWVAKLSAARADATPASGKQRPAAVSGTAACTRHLARLRAELCAGAPSKSAALASAGLDRFRCEHRLDFDGDGRPDQVSLWALPSGKTGLRVRFADGHEEQVGGNQRLARKELGEEPHPIQASDAADSDLSWSRAWEPAPRRGAELRCRGRGSSIPEARGDGLWLSGGDAAAMLVLSAKGWLLVALGY